jgi:hypothetical protein
MIDCGGKVMESSMRAVAGLVVLISLSTVALAQDEASASRSDSRGPYEIVQGKLNREDIYLLNTQTGEVWQLTTMTGFKGDPNVWKAMDKLDFCNNKDACDLEISRVLSKKYDRKTSDSTQTPPAQKKKASRPGR